MNLWLRLMIVLVTARARGPLDPLEPNRRRMRVWPGDLDAMLHMNNGRYLTLMDLGRVEYMIRTGLLGVIRQGRLTPMVSSAAVRYRRELPFLQRYDLETRIVGWLDTTAVFEQRFVLASGPHQGQVAASALVRAGLYDRARRAFVPVEEIMRRLGVRVTPPDLPDTVKAFLAAEETMRTGERGSGA